MSNETTTSPATADIELAREFSERLRHRLHQRVFTVLLFGSRARGEGDPESDLDLLVELQDDDTNGTVANAALDVACDLTLEHGILVSALVADRTFLEKHRGYSFLEAVQTDGIAV